MNGVALPFDSVYEPRSTPYTWHTSMGPTTPPTSMGSQDYSSASSTMSHGSEPSLTPPTVARSLTSSPPRSFFTIAERQRLGHNNARSRRDLHRDARLHRVSNHQSSYHLDSSSSPSLSPIPDVGGSSMEMPATPYITASSTSAVPMSSHMDSYMPSYMQPLNDPSQAQMFATPYTPPVHHGYEMPMDYSPSSNYPSGDYSHRSSPLPVNPHENSIMYMPAIMTAGTIGSNCTSGRASNVNSGSSAGNNNMPTSKGGVGHVRVVQSRPKPRCWEHGCNGRQFSTFSNLLRHQREKSGQAAKASCPNCGAEFTRTTARNGHILHGKCRQRRSS
ncbi:hypothetical protein GMORB2_7392 [Geosmithia morbida]|uniref:Uncharacterized protein n=1 Tax=Geosmithia morbida TaxID=1094350 RepID=A0A9P4YTA1_9HYPO|nr:uncharacterized protein GMORB2_7392 [Geosmithia morbida]KAF4122400.1 hypothetical protein GMORB2_7392 [Geosmithia morbida]